MLHFAKWPMYLGILNTPWLVTYIENLKFYMIYVVQIE